MNRYRRMPALLVVVVAGVLGAAYVVAWGQVEKLWKKGGNQTIEALEKQIAEEGKKAGGVSADTWRKYADALADAKQFSKAAAAYKEVIALQPNQRDAKFQCGLALAQAGAQAGATAGATEEFYNFQKDLVYSEAKLAVDLFERPEAQRYLAEERFSSLAKEAKNQAMD